LRIVGRRDDGYHLLDSIFVPVDLCDRVATTVEGIRRGGETRVAMHCDAAGVPADGTNLAARAATALMAECGFGADIRIRLDKTIPPGTGLGGGSSNAAAVLRGMNGLLGLAVTAPRLAEIALHLGADVPYFLTCRPARVRGIGERIEPLAGWPPTNLVIAIPPVSVPTAWAFRAFAKEPIVPGDEAAALAATGTLSTALLVNDLERVVLPAYPTIATLKRCLLDAGASAAVMSGSGSAVVGVASSPEHARTLAAAVRGVAADVQVHAARVLSIATDTPFAAAAP
jgi:4-diphosphocytidyl-2-C-methyl-D-erythritol kinase